MKKSTPKSGRRPRKTRDIQQKEEDGFKRFNGLIIVPKDLEEESKDFIQM
jgi:hypothetical protein